jgi:hypothetical protein
MSLTRGGAIDAQDYKLPRQIVHICRHHRCLLVASRNIADLADLAAEDPIDDAGVDQHDRKYDDACPPGMNSSDAVV